MKVTVKGLTKSTIVINSLGITLRGYNAQRGSYPTNIARGIVVDSAEIQRELDGLIRAGLIEIIEEKEIPYTPNFSMSDKISEEKLGAANEDDEVDVFAEAAKEMGIVDEEQMSDENATEKEIVVEKPESPADRPKNKLGLAQIEEFEQLEQLENEKPVVMTEAGAARSNDIRVEISDNDDRTRAAIEAMKKLEAEEAEKNEGWEDQVFIDRRVHEAEELTEEMGQEAVVVIHDRQTEVRTMQHNAMEQAGASKNAMVYDIEKQTKAQQEESEYSDAFNDDDIPGADFVEW